MTTSLRAFLRYLVVDGLCQAGLDNAVPTYAHWQLADMPRYLSAEQVNRLIAACDGATSARRRDRAIVLLLARLGLRAGDVAQLRLSDIEWQTGSLRVIGQVALRGPSAAAAGRRRCDRRLPGRSTFRQGKRSRVPAHDCSLSAVPTGDGISSVVKRVMKRAGIATPVKGAHVLRHTAATEMLRHGVPLDEDRSGPPASRRRHDGLLRQGRCRAPEAGRSALAGGAVMLSAIETYLTLRALRASRCRMRSTC